MFLLGCTFFSGGEICKNVNRASNGSLNDADLAFPSRSLCRNRVLAGFLGAEDVWYLNIKREFQAHLQMWFAHITLVQSSSCFIAKLSEQRRHGEGRGGKRNRKMHIWVAIDVFRFWPNLNPCQTSSYAYCTFAKLPSVNLVVSPRQV